MVTMVTRCWGQVTTVVPVCVLTARAACGSSQEVVTAATTPSRPSVSATLDTEVKNFINTEMNTEVKLCFTLFQQVN